MQIPASALAEIHALYNQARYLQAHRLLEPFGAPEELEGTPARLIAARLLAQLGADRRSAGLFYRTCRADRKSPEARYYYVRTVLQRHGPLAAWRLANTPALSDGADAQIRADWHAMRATILGALRDFDRAYAALDEADRLVQDHPWFLVERASVLQADDRYEEALATANRSLSIQPHYAPGAREAGHLLHLLGRDAEALAVLEDAAKHTESGLICAQLATIQTELHRYHEARASLELAVERTPLADKDFVRWAAAMSFEIAYALGDYDAAAAHARSCGIGYFSKVAERIESAPPDAKRVVLPIAFVRQHHMTCAPATLSAISGYWKMPADHLDIAEEICYDGTPWHSERAWADSHGWVTREFAVTWESAKALIDRGVPFTLTTAGAGYAHLQAVAGYDERQGTLLIRDPFVPYLISPLGRELLESLRPYGRRGLAFVPEGQRDRLDDIDLADHTLYDGLYAVERALEAHRRPEASAILGKMLLEAPEHPITLHARRAISGYDSDLPSQTSIVAAMRAQFPEEPNLALAQIRCLRELDRREERIHILESLTSRPLRSKEDAAALRADGQAQMPRMAPIFWQEYARELSDDAREHARVVTLLARAMRYDPTAGENYHTLAMLSWRDGMQSEALELYRFAACLEPLSERLSRSYFTAARWLNRADEAVAFLRSRFTRLASRSPQPAMTLFGAMEQLDRQHEMFQILGEALALRPDDSELLLFCVDANGRYGRLAEAESCLSRAQGKTARASWLRGVAELAGLRGDHAQALSAWREVSQAEPLAMDALQAITRLLSQYEGQAAGARHFEALAARFPHHAEVHRSWAQWLRSLDSRGQQIEVLSRLKAIDGADAWCRRELAIVLAGERRFDEATVEAEMACSIDPSNSASFSALGETRALAGDVAGARHAFHKALALRADDVFAMRRLIELCDTPADTRDALQYAAAEMSRQPLLGESLPAFRWFAHRALRSHETDALLQNMLQARPDLWQAWSAWIDELRETDRLFEARRIAEDAASRFPLTPRLWQDLAEVRAAQNDHVGERDALQRALTVTPADCRLLRALAESWAAAGEMNFAREMFDRAVAMDPLDPQNHAALARHLWVTNAREAAIARVHHILLLDPNQEWAWSVLRPWSSALGRGAEADQTAREMAAKRPLNPAAWMTLAGVLHRPADLPERLQALDRAIGLDSRCYEARDLKAQLLATERRYAEAADACSLPGTPESKLPILLRARLAEIEADRGDLRSAVRKLDSAILTEPSYAEGWLLLLRWRKQLNDFAGAVEAATQLTRLRPHHPMAWGNLGCAQLDATQAQEARVSLRRALDLDPTYEYAAFTLIDLLLNDNAFTEADQIVRLVLPHRHEGWPLALAVQVCAKRNDAASARALMEELCTLPGDHNDSVLYAGQHLEAAKMVLDIKGACESAFRNGATQKEVGALWARATAMMDLWPEAFRTADLSPSDAIKGRALSSWISAMEMTNRREDLRRLIEANRGWARRSTPGWAAIANGLLTMGQYAEVVKWTDDWRVREEMRPWPLLIRALALRHLGRPLDAAEVSRAALKLEEDSSMPQHALWLLVDAGIDGAAGQAAQFAAYVQSVDPVDMPPFYQFLYWLHMAMSAITDHHSQPDRSSRFALARKQLGLARAARPQYRAHKLLASLYRRTALRVARASGVPWAYAWFAVHAFTIR